MSTAMCRILICYRAAACSQNTLLPQTPSDNDGDRRQTSTCTLVVDICQKQNTVCNRNNK